MYSVDASEILPPFGRLNDKKKRGMTMLTGMKIEEKNASRIGKRPPGIGKRLPASGIGSWNLENAFPTWEPAPENRKTLSHIGKRLTGFRKCFPATGNDF